MFPGPVFFAEMRSSSRKKRVFVARFALGLLLLLTCAISFGSIDPKTPLPGREMTRFAEGFFAAIAIAQGVAVALITPAIVAPAIAEERSRKTLDYSLASRLTSWEIVVGKLLARLSHVFVFLLVGMPIVCLLMMFGGIEPLSVLIDYAMAASIVLFLGGISIGISVVSPGPREAVFLSYGIAAFWLCLAPVVIGPVGEFWPELVARFEPVVDVLKMTNPLMLWEDGPEVRLRLIAILSIAGLLLIAASVLLLRPSARALREGGHRVRRRFRLFRRRAVLDDAMKWKETQVRRAPGLIGRTTGVLMLLAVIWLGMATVRQSQESWSDVLEFGYGTVGRDWSSVAFNQFLREYGTALYVLILLSVTTSAACSITVEREADTWISLVASPLDAREILRAKRAGVYRRLRPLLLCPIALWTYGLIAGGIHPIGYLITLVLYAVYVSSAAALGIFVSLRCGSTARAMTVSIVATLILHVGYLFACVLFSRTLVMAFASSPFAMFLAPMSYRDMQLMDGPYGLRDFTTVPEFALLAVCSLLFHAGLAIVLNLVAIWRFDRVEDRPTMVDPG